MVWFGLSLLAITFISFDVVAGLQSPWSLPCLMLLTLAVTKLWRISRRFQHECHIQVLSRYVDRQNMLDNSINTRV